MSDCDSCSPPSTSRCREYSASGGVVCTRDKNHPGDHVACGDIHHHLASWATDSTQTDLLTLLEGDPT